MVVPVEVDEAASSVHPPVNAFGEANLHVGELAAGPERLGLGLRPEETAWPRAAEASVRAPSNATPTPAKIFFKSINAPRSAEIEIGPVAAPDVR
jgi:hypothetical protein